MWASKYIFKGSVKSNEIATVIKENTQDMQEISVNVQQKKSKIIYTLRMVTGKIPKDYKEEVFYNFKDEISYQITKNDQET